MKCISVTMSDGTVVNATVDNNVSELDKSDIEQLEAWVKYVKARRLRSKNKLTKERGASKRATQEGKH